MSVMFAGFIILSFISHKNMQEMEDHINKIYFGNLVPIVKLQNIIKIYSDDVLANVYRVSKNEEDCFEAKEILTHSLIKIKKYWGEYKAIYKTSDEKTVINHVDDSIEYSKMKIQKVIDIYGKCRLKDIKRVSTKKLSKSIKKAQDMITMLIEHELQVAREHRKTIKGKYEITMGLLFLITIAISLFAAVITLPITKNIKKNQADLSKYAKRLKYTNEDLKESVIRDPMTGLYNRRFFKEVVNKELKKASREQKSIAFFMVDIDFFKQYNDTYGHGKGDEALIAVAKTLKSILRRPGDYVFRLGGEEFGAFLYDTDEENTQKLAQKVLSTIRTLKIEHEQSKVSDVLTVSIGAVITDRTDVFSDDDLANAADTNLYEAKEAGRARAIITTI